MDGSSCHRVFYILHILGLILDHLSGDKRSLLHLACCSRALSSPSLDYLWADLDSITPFAPLLPNAVQDLLAGTMGLPEPDPALTKEHNFEKAAQRRSKCPPPEEWKIFDAYACRVRHMRHGYPNRALYRKLVAIRPGVDLFPRLLSLQLDLPDEDLELGMMFFPSSLRSLMMYNLSGTLHKDGGGAEIAIRQAALDAPLLEEFHFIGAYQPLLGTEPSPLDFKQLHTLHLNVSLVEDADVRRLWCLFGPSPIRTLKINLRDCSALVRDPQNSLTPPAFSNVETITINNSPPIATAILSRMSSSHLHSVIIDSHDSAAKVEEYEQLVALLAQHHPFIHSLHVRMGAFFAVYPDFLRRFLAALEPLMHAGLSRLRLELPLHSTCGFDKNITRKLAAEAGPTLEYFEFVQLEPPPCTCIICNSY